MAELAAMILFFALCAAAVLALFAAADRRAQRAEELSGAILAASSAAELVRVSEAPGEDFAACYGAAAVNDGYEAWLDASFQPGDAQEYILRLECEKAGGVYEMTVTVQERDGSAIYALTCASFPGGGA